jgi:hypothetical protein
VLQFLFAGQLPDHDFPGQLNCCLLLQPEHGSAGIEGFSIFPLNTESTFSDFFELQAGQVTLSFSSLDLKRTSKSLPQSLHRNSNMGN